MKNRKIDRAIFIFGSSPHDISTCIPNLLMCWPLGWFRRGTDQETDREMFGSGFAFFRLPHKKGIETDRHVGENPKKRPRPFPFSVHNTGYSTNQKNDENSHKLRRKSGLAHFGRCKSIASFSRHYAKEAHVWHFASIRVSTTYFSRNPVSHLVKTIRLEIRNPPEGWVIFILHIHWYQVFCRTYGGQEGANRFSFSFFTLPGHAPTRLDTLILPCRARSFRIMLDAPEWDCFFINDVRFTMDDG